jgi:hypothetical protein
MYGLIRTAMRPAVTSEADDLSVREKRLQAAAVSFKAWLTDWRGTGAAGIMRRDYLISLGLASRRASTTGEEIDDDEPTPAPPTETPAAEPSTPQK